MSKLNLRPLIPYKRIGEHFDDEEEGIFKGRFMEREEITTALREYAAIYTKSLREWAEIHGDNFTDALGYGDIIFAEELADELDPDKGKK